VHFPLPKARFLDPRERDYALASPIVDAANIPLSELASRAHELPPAHQQILVAAPAPLFDQVNGELLSRGRAGYQVPFEFSEEPYRPTRLWEPHPLVLSAVERLAPGRALDLGCGTGRDAIYLASAGWEVVAIDNLQEALERGRLTADRLLGEAASRITWRHGDVTASLGYEEEFDHAQMLMFFDARTMQSAAQALRPGATLLVEAFTPTNRAKTGRPKNPALTLAAAEVPNLLPTFQIHQAEEATRPTGKHPLHLVAIRDRGGSSEVAQYVWHNDTQDGNASGK